LIILLKIAILGVSQGGGPAVALGQYRITLITQLPVLTHPSVRTGNFLKKNLISMTYNLAGY